MSNIRTDILFEEKSFLDVIRGIFKYSIDFQFQYGATFLKYLGNSVVNYTKKDEILPSHRNTSYNWFIRLRNLEDNLLGLI